MKRLVGPITDADFRKKLVTVSCVLSIAVAALFPRSLMALKNYDAVALAMGNQTVIFHLFALPTNVAIELANLLFTGKMQGTHKGSNHGKNAKSSDTSSNAGIFNAERRFVVEIEESVIPLDFLAPKLGVSFAVADVSVILQGFSFLSYGIILVYFFLMMLMVVRPRNGVLPEVTRTNIRKTKESRP
ncbi:MAG: hypothetical protein JW803_00045 [Endomicrobiales bacterium]|nr:hypothetical protein [Endomicrobiales bacterium]